MSFNCFSGRPLNFDTQIGVSTLHTGDDQRGDHGVCGGEIHQACGAIVGGEHAAKLFGEDRVGLRERLQQGSAPLGRFRKKSLELDAEFAEFFSQHHEPVVNDIAEREGRSVLPAQFDVNLPR